MSAWKQYSKNVWILWLPGVENDTNSWQVSCLSLFSVVGCSCCRCCSRSLSHLLPFCFSLSLSLSFYLALTPSPSLSSSALLLTMPLSLSLTRSFPSLIFSLSVVLLRCRNPKQTLLALSACAIGCKSACACGYIMGFPLRLPSLLVRADHFAPALTGPTSEGLQTLPLHFLGMSVPPQLLQLSLRNRLDLN